MAAQIAHDHTLPRTKELDLGVPIVVGRGDAMDEDERRGAISRMLIEESGSRQGQVRHGHASASRSWERHS